MTMQNLKELTPVELMHVERIGRTARRAVDLTVGRADYEAPAGPQYPAGLGDKFLLAVEMFDGFE
jgi:hypothetical protein